MSTDDSCICAASTRSAKRPTAGAFADRAAPLVAVVVVGALLGTTFKANAQLQSLAGASVEYIPRANLDPRPAGMEDFEIGFTTARAWAVLPISVGDGGTTLVPGVHYAVTVADTENDPSNTSPDSFHEIGVSFGLMQRISRAWNLMMRLEPSLATNFVDVDRNHFRFSGMALATHDFNDALRFGFGAAVNYVFGDLLPLPALSLDWTPGRIFRLQLLFPRFARAVFRLGDRVELGLMSFLQGNRYTVNYGDRPLVNSVKYTVAHGGAVAGVRLFSQLWLSGYIGYTFYRQFKIFDDDNNQVADPDIENAMIGRVALEFRPAPERPTTAVPRQR